MIKQRKKYDTSFKLEVVRIIQEEGLSVQHVSQSMGRPDCDSSLGGAI
jgi:transposase